MTPEEQAKLIAALEKLITAQTERNKLTDAAISQMTESMKGMVETTKRILAIVDRHEAELGTIYDELGALSRMAGQSVQ